MAAKKFSSPSLIVLAVMVIYTDDCLCQFSPQPMDIARTEGATYVIIPCPNDDGLPIWSINGYYYDAYSLPNWYQLAMTGLVIPVVYEEMNNTAFTCYYSTGNRLDMQESSTGVLTVLPGPDSGNSPAGTEDGDECLFLDHSEMFFGEDELTIAVKKLSNECSTSYELDSRNDCRLSSQPFSRKPSNGAVIKINRTTSSSGEDIPVFYIVSGYNEHEELCSRGEALFKINKSVTTSIEKVSIYNSREIIFTFPSNLETYSLIIPTGTDSGSKDCYCPIFFTITANCSDISKCPCINITNYDPSKIQVCKNLKTSFEFDVAINFTNLTSSSNNTKLFFAGQKSGCAIDSLTLDYFESFEIIHALPDLPNIEPSTTTGKVCLSLRYIDGIPAEQYIITVSDISGSETHRSMLTNVSECADVGHSFQFPECAPFTVSVNATNSEGFRNTSEIIGLDEQRSDLCSCVNKRVSVNFDTKESTEKIEVNVYCRRIDYVDLSGVEFEARIGPNRNVSSHNILKCGDKMQFSNLDCKVPYNISAYWRSPIDGALLCQVDLIYDIFPTCRDLYGLIALIALPVGIVAIIIGSCYFCCRRRHAVRIDGREGHVNEDKEDHYCKVEDT